MSKRVFALLLAALMLLSLSACGASPEQAAAEGNKEKESAGENTAEAAPTVTPSPLEQLIAEAEAGDAEAMVRLGNMYRDGDGVEADWEKAGSWYEKAGEAGDGNAYQWLGNMYFSVSEEQGDYGRAFEAYSKSAGAGVADGMGMLGLFYGNGYGVEQDLAKAVQWYEKAVDAGCTWAMGPLGYYYLSGMLESGVEEAKGIAVLTRAAETGYSGAYITLGNYYHYQVKDYDKAEEYYLKAAEAGEARGYKNLGIMFMYSAHDDEKAVKYLTVAAETGDSDAMARLGDFYSDFEGRGRQDYVKAVEWYTKSAEAEDPSAYGTFQLGQAYNYGYGVHKDYEKAFALFNSAVEIWKSQNSTDTFFAYTVEQIGDMYSYGRGVEKDKEKAAEYYAWAEELNSGE